MNIFRLKTTWSNAELYLFKLGVFAAGVIFGVYAGKYIQPYIIGVWLIAIVGCISAAYFWVTKVRQ